MTDAAPLLLAPAILAAVLVLSAVAKMHDPRSTATVLALLRVPPPLAGPVVARLHPWAEVLLAAALLATPAGPAYVVVGVLTVGLFAAYWLLIARALGFDPRPTCGCFGRIGNHRVSARTLLRNTALLALAGLTLAWAAAGGSVPGAVAGAGSSARLRLAVAVGAVAVVLLTVALVSLRRRLLRPGAGAPVDDRDYLRSPFPPVVLLDGDAARSLHDLTAARAALLVFDAPDPTAVAGWRTLLAELDVHGVATPSPEGRTPADALADPGGRVATALGCPDVPCGVLLGADGLLAGGPVTGPDALAGFVGDIRAELDGAGGG